MRSTAPSTSPARANSWPLSTSACSRQPPRFCLWIKRQGRVKIKRLPKYTYRPIDLTRSGQLLALVNQPLAARRRASVSDQASGSGQAQALA